MPQQIDVPGMGIVEFPDGMADDAIAAAIKQNLSEQPSTAGDVAKSGGIGVAKGLVGLAGLPGDLSELGARGIDRATRFIGGKLGVDVPVREDRPPTYGSSDIQKGIEKTTGEFYKPKTTAGEYAQTVGEFAPGLIGTGGAGALARRAITQVAAPGLASEAAGQYTKGKEVEPYARVAGALAGGLAPSAIGRAITPNPASPARQRLVDILNDEGVTSLTAGQRTGSDRLKYAETFLGDAPMAGGQASRIQNEGQRQFTEAAMRRAGSGPEATPEVLAKNNERLGREFQQLSARNTLTPDNQFITDVVQAVRDYRNVPPSQQRAIVQGYVDDIVQHINSGQMPGAQYQEMRSRLSRQANALRNSDPTLSDALRDMRNALDNAMGRSIAPADREAWQTARREYGAQKVIEKATSKAGEATAEGQIVPANLRNTVSAENRGAYARGEGQFSELSRAGSGVMAPLPNSGTAQRASLFNILNQLTLGAVPAVAGRAIMSGPGQRYLGNQLATPMLRDMNPQQAAIVSALLASSGDRAPLRITVNPQSRQ